MRQVTRNSIRSCYNLWNRLNRNLLKFILLNFLNLNFQEPLTLDAKKRLAAEQEQNLLLRKQPDIISAQINNISSSNIAFSSQINQNSVKISSPLDSAVNVFNAFVLEPSSSTTVTNYNSIDLSEFLPSSVAEVCIINIFIIIDKRTYLFEIFFRIFIF